MLERLTRLDDAVDVGGAVVVGVEEVLGEADTDDDTDAVRVELAVNDAVGVSDDESDPLGVHDEDAEKDAVEVRVTGLLETVTEGDGVNGYGSGTKPGGGTLLVQYAAGQPKPLKTGGK